MSEALFPIFGAAFVMFVMMPASALMARAVLAFLEWRGGQLHGLTSRFVVLVGSSAIPLGWLLSSGLHQAESGQSSATCLFVHDVAASCFEPGFFALALGAILVVRCVGPLRSLRSHSPGRSKLARRSAERIDGVARRHGLGWLAPRLVVTDEPGFALAVEGLLWPRVVVGASFVVQLDDEALAASLSHEAEHVRSFDPLRYLMLAISIAANPFGRRFLEADVARWLRSREAHCDREAVIQGAKPLSLAAAIVNAARPHYVEGPALGSSDTAVLKFRIGLLFAFIEAPPARCCSSKASFLPAVMLVALLVVLLPHQGGSAMLDALHSGIEQSLTYFWH